MNKTAHPSGRIVLALSTLSLGTALLAGGCEKKEDVRSYSAPKEGGGTAAASADAPKAGKQVEWTVPAGWKELPQKDMWVGGFSISQADPSALVTVIPLNTSPLVANVNRWEAQVGLPPSNAEQVEKLTRHVDLPGGHADVFDLTGPEAAGKKPRIIVAMIERGPQTWFVKMTASADIAEAQKANFDAFLNSLKFAGSAPAGGHDHDHDHDPKAGVSPAGPATPSSAPAAPTAPPAAAAPTGPEKLANFKASENWVRLANAGMMREMTFKLTAPEVADEVVVSRLPNDGAGGLLGNVNRWRQQVGLTDPLAEVNEKQIARVTIAGQEAMLFDFAGPNKRQIVVKAPRGPTAWYFKVIGDPKVVAANEEAFKKFLASIEFAPE